MDVPLGARDQSCPLKQNVERKFSAKTYAIQLLLVLTLLLSFSHIGKLFGKLDTVIFYPLVDTASPEAGNVQRDSLDFPSSLMDEYLDHGVSRKIETAEIDDSQNTNEATIGIVSVLDVQKKQESEETPSKTKNSVDEHVGMRGSDVAVPTVVAKDRVTVSHNITANNTLPQPAEVTNSAGLDSRNAANKRIAIVVRSMDPIRPAIKDRLIQIAEIFQKDEFKNYDFHIMVDQTKQKLTTTETLQQYFRSQNASHLKAPTVFSITEKMIMEEFPKLATGYVPGPLVDGSKGTCCGQPLLWQLLIPTFVTFVHYHQEADYTWVLEDDLWTIGTPIVELLRTWDEKLWDKNASLVGSRLGTNGIPYSRMTKERHTEGFRDILIAMKATGWQHRNRTLLKMDGQVRSKIWNEWGGKRLPIWSCMSDTLYRHSRDFGNYVYSMVKSNVYQFAECYQMPLAWYGGFSIVDIKKILPNIDDDYKDGRRDEPGIHLRWEDVAYNRKLEHEQARIRFQDYRKTTNVSASIYHEIFVPSNGSEFRTRREHPKLCSLSFDWHQDCILTANCEKTLRSAALHKATGVIFIGNNPLSKIFNNFLPPPKTAKSKTADFKYQILKNDGYSELKNKFYYQYPAVNHDEWMVKKAQLANEISADGKSFGKGKCKICRQVKLKSLRKNLTLETLLVETSRDLFFPTLTTTTSQETVAKWISDHYQDHENTVCIIQMNGFEMTAAPLRTKSEFLGHTRKFHELLKPTCGTIIRFGFLPHFSTKTVKEIVSWDEGLRDLILDDSSLNGYFIDVSGAKKDGSNNRYSKPLWKMFVRLIGLPYSDFGM